MTTTKFDITIPQSGTWRLIVGVTGGPESLDGYVGSMQIRQIKSDEAVLADIPASRFTVYPENRQVVLVLTDEDTAAYNWSHPAVYDLYIEGPDGDRWRVIEGVAKLNKTVTREI